MLIVGAGHDADEGEAVCVEAAGLRPLPCVPVHLTGTRGSALL